MIASDEKAELRALIRAEIAGALNILLTAQTKDAGQFTESIDGLVPGYPVIADRPLIQPYGLASVAPDGTLNFTARVGEHPGNRVVLGHRDANKPLLDDGESALYSFGGYLVRVFNDKIQVGKGDDYQTVVCGEHLAVLLGQLLTAVVAHTHAGPGSPPTNASAFTSLKSNFVDNELILAKDEGGF